MKRIAELMMHVAGLSLAVSAIRAKAMRLYRRHYFIDLLTATSSEEAADKALSKTKARSQQMIAEHAVTKALENRDRDEVWGDILEVLVEWQMLLINIPIDKARIRPDANITVSPDADLDGEITDSFLLPQPKEGNT